ncbi:putative toxin-antitoxin system toxin component, PIN family [Burkholderia pseudomultivorans]|uniref:Nucleotide-binding protein n=1 Tax=Burkholderia pseudomultivorans TaxID=1207504 RepID=A0A132ERC0_9BURK|nr:putative toxin-antitoxin system toxin component, PIN family [Burkholderia pseudomultivorans]KWF01201.1 nucleotide-binding protein [Burkholderia pseudomultivorans]KWF56447.1 nucleotide-binding protein [Burkholderia pseudomultivorans]
MPSSLAPPVARRVVLDSNVWIDILVFDDPATRPIRAALECGALAAVIDSRCLTELEHVLDYPQFQARAIDKAAALATVARLARLVEPAPVAADAPPLPKCKDRDDQKFLELARAAQAEWLVSKDRALLKLAKRTARDFGFRIAQPAPFNEACALDAAPAATATATPA